MPKNIPTTLEKYDHKQPKKQEFAPFCYNHPVYGKCSQIIERETNLPILPKRQIKQVQSKIGTCLYYTQGVDPTILVVLKKLATQQAQPMEKNRKELVEIV